MDTMQAIRERKSTRSFSGEQVGPDVLDQILEAASCAPVAMGAYDSLHLTVVQDAGLLKRIAEGASAMASRMLGRARSMDFGAPTMVVVSSKPATMPGHENLNVGCVAQSMAVAATGLGVDSLVWGAATAAICADAGLAAELGIPEGFAPVLAVSLGHAASEEGPKSHKIAVNRV